MSQEETQLITLALAGSGGLEKKRMKEIEWIIRIAETIILTIVPAGCGVVDWQEALFERQEVLVIRGRTVISGETFEIRPGTKVIFKCQFESVGNPPTSEWSGVIGHIVITHGARLIARGTKENPIAFEEGLGGDIIFEESSDGENSIIQYCKFKGNFIECESSVTIQYCKFDDGSRVDCFKNSKALLKFNMFSGGNHSIYIWDDAEPIIEYNDIKNGDSGITRSGSGSSIPRIGNNNIENMAGKAILNNGEVITIENNYIANCSGELGVDTTGNQCHGVIYVNPRTKRIPDAGCGW